jgi:hypothetical protein
VTLGNETEEGNMFDPKQELVLNKSVEMFAESIPGEDNCARKRTDESFLTSLLALLAGCILQIYALLQANELATRAVASIAISALTAGMASATVS